MSLTKFRYEDLQYFLDLSEFHRLTLCCFKDEIHFDACPLDLCRKYFWTEGKISNFVCVLSALLLHILSSFFRRQELYCHALGNLECALHSSFQLSTCSLG